MESVLDDHSTHHITAEKDRVPFFQKAIYSVGGLVNNIQAAAIGSMVIVLNLGLGINPALVGLIGAIPRLVDAISDPVTGYFSDNIRTRWGRRRPMIFGGAIAGGLFFALMFQLYKGHTESYYFWYFLAFQILFFIGFTCYSIPWIALGYEMTPDYHERTRLQGASNFVAQFAWVLAPWFFKFMNNKSMFTDMVHGARVLSIIVGVFIVLGGILPAIFNKEFFHDLPRPNIKGALNVMRDFFKGAAIAFRCGPFVKLCVATLLVFGGFMLASAFTAYVFFFYVYGGESTMDMMYQKGGTLLGVNGSVSSVCTFCVIFFTTWLSTKIGKRRTFLITISISIIGYALKWIGYNPSQPYLILISAPFIAFGLGSLFTLMSSMVADVCDLDELQTGTRREGMFSAIYWWMVKLGVALASILSGLLLNATGFHQELGLNQVPETLLWMRIFDIGIPILTSAIAIYLVATFDISEDKAYDIRKTIERRREERRKEARRGEDRNAEDRRKNERRK